MEGTHHSEYLKIESLCIKPAKNAFVSKEVLGSQWESLNYLSQPNFELALEEYEAFKNHFEKSGIDIFEFPFDELVQMDSIYCRDASIVTDFGVIICNMGKDGRINEPQSQRNYFELNGINILGEIKPPGTIEGGDVAWLDTKTLAVAHSYRTNRDGIRQLKLLLEPKGIDVIVVELPHYKGKSDVFHLMSILSPVDKNLVVVYSPLMPIAFRNDLLDRGFDFVEVPDEEFESMGCNVLALAPRQCMMVDGNSITEHALLEKGCEVLCYKGEEISVKGGGGPTCLTRPMVRLF